jgi:MFS family permease
VETVNATVIYYSSTGTVRALARVAAEGAEKAFAMPVAISFLIGFALFGTATYVPAFLQIVQGATASQAGLALTAPLAGVLLTTVISGRLITRTGRYKLYPVVGTAAATVGLALLATLGPERGTRAISGPMLLIGLGIGLVMQVMMLATQNAVEYRDLGAATATVTFLRQVGASAGVAVAGAVITWRTGDQAPPPVTFAEAMTPLFGLMALLLAVACVLAIALPARPLRTTAYVQELSCSLHR